MTKVSALGGWVLIRPDKRAEETSSGIIIPDSVTEYGYTRGTVVSASSEYVDRSTSTVKNMPIRVDDVVMYRDYLKDLETITIENRVCCFIYIDDIALVLESADGGK